MLSLFIPKVEFLSSGEKINTWNFNCSKERRKLSNVAAEFNFIRILFRFQETRKEAKNVQLFLFCPFNFWKNVWDFLFVRLSSTWLKTCTSLSVLSCSLFRLVPSDSSLSSFFLFISCHFYQILDHGFWAENILKNFLIQNLKSRHNVADTQRSALNKDFSLSFFRFIWLKEFLIISFLNFSPLLAISIVSYSCLLFLLFLLLSQVHNKSDLNRGKNGI